MTDMTDLPPEVLQVVFSCLPLQTLLTTCTRVCPQWRDIISQNKFLQWRKLYYRYKADSELTFQAKWSTKVVEICRDTVLVPRSLP